MQSPAAPFAGALEASQVFGVHSKSSTVRRPAVHLRLPLIVVPALQVSLQVDPLTSAVLSQVPRSVACCTPTMSKFWPLQEFGVHVAAETTPREQELVPLAV